MKWTRFLRVALSSIRRNKTRSLLTALGIIIGVASVIVMVGVGQGAQADIRSQIEAMGTNVLMVRVGSANFRGVSGGAGSSGRRMTPADVDEIAEQTRLVRSVSGVVNSRQQVVGGEGNWSTSITGVSPAYLDIRDWNVASGEFINVNHVRVRAKVAVLGKTVADELFPGTDPVGQKVRIGAQPFEVIGVLAAKGQGGMGEDQDDIVLAPLTTVLYRLRGGQYVDMMMMSAVSAALVDSATEEVRGLLRTQRKLDEGEDDDFTIRTQSEIIERASSTTRTMTLLLGAIAAVSLIVGGIGIMNIMFVSVTERTREIGIRMAVGARGGDILTQFLTESVVLSAAGGIIGIIFAALLALLMNTVFKVTTIISVPIALLAFLFAAAVGVFFGFYPARKAARLNPIDALRHE